jgi:cis-3-alkyl-4-acyloxetan-2-one decarboxylase
MASAGDWRSLYPFPSHDMILDGHRYHYLDEGAGPAVLMVHGNPTWSFYWRELVRALREKYRVIVPDHIGCGLSDKPSPRDYSYRLTRRIQDLNALIERLDLRRITLIVHDWGGPIGVGSAVAAPERYARLVLMNTAVFRSDRCPWQIRACGTPVLGQFIVQGLNLFAREALRSTVFKPERMTPAVRAGFLSPYDTWQHRTAVYRFVRDIPRNPQHPSYPTICEIEDGLKKLQQHPTCIIWGMRDWCFTPWFLERLIEFFPAAEVHRLEDAAHYLVEDAHEQIVVLLEEFFHKHPVAQPPSAV